MVIQKVFIFKKYLKVYVREWSFVKTPTKEKPRHTYKSDEDTLIEF